MTPEEAKVGRRSAGTMGAAEFRYRLDHLEECIKRLEQEVSGLKASGQVQGPKLQQIEADLAHTQRELSNLQGQGIAHGVRLDNIDKTLASIREEVGQFHRTLKDEVGAVRAQLTAHTTQEEAWQRKMLFTGVTMLLGIIATFISGFLLKFLVP